MSSPKFSPPKVLGRVDHVVVPSGREQRRHSSAETAVQFARRVKRTHGLDVTALKVQAFDALAAQGAERKATRAGVVVLVGPEGAALAETVVGAVQALRSELATAGHVTGVRKARSVAEGLAAACIAKPGALAALEAADAAKLRRLLGAPVVIRPDGDGRLVVLVPSPSAKAIGCPAGRCHAADIFAAAGRLNGMAQNGGAA